VSKPEETLSISRPDDVVRWVVNTQQAVCFPGMTSSLAKSKQINGCTLLGVFF